MRLSVRIVKVLQMMHVPSALLLLVLVGTPAWRASGSAALGMWRALPVCLASLGCFCVNDAMDYRRDEVNKPYRAIPSGAITPRAAMALGLILSAAAVLCGIAVGDSLAMRGAYAFIAAASVAYSPLIRVVGPAKGLYVSVVLAVAFLLAIELGGAAVGEAPFLVAVVTYCCGKELLMDVWDMEGDAADGALTLPLALGTGPAYALIGASQVSSLALFLLAGVGVAPIAVAAVLVLAVDALAIVDAFLPGEGRAFRRASMYLAWLPLLACSVPLLV